MAEDPKDTPKDFPGCCEGMPFPEMMRKILEVKKSGSFSCAGLMSQMREICCGGGTKKEDCAEKREDEPVPNR